MRDIDEIIDFMDCWRTDVMFDFFLRHGSLEKCQKYFDILHDLISKTTYSEKSFKYYLSNKLKNAQDEDEKYIYEEVFSYAEPHTAYFHRTLTPADDEEEATPEVAIPTFRPDEPPSTGIINELPDVMALEEPIEALAPLLPTVMPIAYREMTVMPTIDREMAAPIRITVDENGFLVVPEVDGEL